MGKDNRLHELKNTTPLGYTILRLGEHEISIEWNIVGPNDVFFYLDLIMSYDDGKAPTELKRRNKDILDPCLNIHYCLCACNLLPLILGP